MGTKISELTAANAAAINADPTYFCVIVDGANRKVELTEVVASLGLADVATSGAYADLTGKPTLGTAAAIDVGTTANKVVQLTAAAKLPAVDGSLVTSIPYSGLTGKPTLGTASELDVGTTANKVVQLDGDAKLPAVDGSNLTNLPGGFSGDYADLTGKPTLGTASELDVGTTANKVVQLDGDAKLPAVDGSALTGVVAENPFDQDLNTTDPATHSSLVVTGPGVTVQEVGDLVFAVDDGSDAVFRIDSAGNAETLGQMAAATLKQGGVDLPDFSAITTDGDYKLVLASGVWTLEPLT